MKIRKKYGVPGTITLVLFINCILDGFCKNNGGTSIMLPSKYVDTASNLDEVPPYCLMARILVRA